MGLRKELILMLCLSLSRCLPSDSKFRIIKPVTQPGDGNNKNNNQSGSSDPKKINFPDPQGDASEVFYETFYSSLTLPYLVRDDDNDPLNDKVDKSKTEFRCPGDSVLIGEEGQKVTEDPYKGKYKINKKYTCAFLMDGKGIPIRKNICDDKISGTKIPQNMEDTACPTGMYVAGVVSEYNDVGYLRDKKLQCCNLVNYKGDKITNYYSHNKENSPDPAKAEYLRQIKEVDFLANKDINTSYDQDQFGFVCAYSGIMINHESTDPTQIINNNYEDEELNVKLILMMNSVLFHKNTDDGNLSSYFCTFLTVEEG